MLPSDIRTISKRVNGVTFLAFTSYPIFHKLFNDAYLDLVVAAEAVKLIQQLQHRSLYLPVPRLLPPEPLRSDGVQLINEDDRPALHDKKNEKRAWPRGKTINFICCGCRCCCWRPAHQ